MGRLPAGVRDRLERCNTEDAPWHIVPADRKWYRNWAITRLLIEHLDGLGLDWPQPDFDVELERKRLDATREPRLSGGGAVGGSPGDDEPHRDAVVAQPVAADVVGLVHRHRHPQLVTAVDRVHRELADAVPASVRRGLDVRPRDASMRDPAGRAACLKVNGPMIWWG